MLKSLAFRSRMPLRSLVVVGMVGFLAGCGGGGGGGGSEPAPAPVALDAQIVWQPGGLAAGAGIGDIAVSRNGRVHVAWIRIARESITDGVSDITAHISYSDDGGATWATTEFTGVEKINQILVMSTGMLVATGWDVSDVDLSHDFNAGIWTGMVWTSVDNGTTWQRRQISRPASVDQPAAPLWLVDGMAERNGQVVFVTKRHPDEPTYPDPEKMGVYLWDPVTDAVADWSFEFENGGGTREFGGMAVAADGTVFLGKSQRSSPGDEPYGAAVFRSAAGAAWERLAPFDYDSVEMKDLTLLADGTLLAFHGHVYEGVRPSPPSPSDARLHRSADGRTWMEPAGISGIATGGSQIIELASGAISMGAFQQFSCDRGATWQLASHDVYSLARYSVYSLARQAPDGTLWLGHGTPSPGGYDFIYEVLKAVPPAGVAARDFVKCP